MNRTARTVLSALAALVAMLTLTAAATAGSSPTTGISAGYGCSIACIESALVTPTASSASVEVRTSVPTSVTVAVSKLDAALGLAAAPTPKHISLPSFLKIRTVLFTGLEPATAYRIVVSARDLSGSVQTRSGTFGTRAVKVAVEQPDLGLSAGLGCKADCLEQGTLTSDASVPGRARLVLHTSVPATFQIRFVAKSASGGTLHQLIHSTGSRKTEHEATIDGLLTGTRYEVKAKATDAQGRSWEETGTFRTRSAQAVVTFHKITVISDSEKGADRGEIYFDFRAGGVEAPAMGFRKLGSGDTIAVKAPGTSRPGLMVGVPIDGRARLDIDVLGVECDGSLMKNCVVEAGSWMSGGYAGDMFVATSTSVDLREAFAPSGALPPGYGTGLPAGHDAYAVWETTQYSLKFRVYATVDVQVS
jgi:hypothetical protein